MRNPFKGKAGNANLLLAAIVGALILAKKKID